MDQGERRKPRRKANHILRAPGMKRENLMMVTETEEVAMRTIYRQQERKRDEVSVRGRGLIPEWIDEAVHGWLS